MEDDRAVRPRQDAARKRPPKQLDACLGLSAQRGGLRLRVGSSRPPVMEALRRAAMVADRRGLRALAVDRQLQEVRLVGAAAACAASSPRTRAAPATAADEPPAAVDARAPARRGATLVACVSASPRRSRSGGRSPISLSMMAARAAVRWMSRSCLATRGAQRLVEVGVPERVPELQRAPRDGALALGDDLGHVAVEQLDRERRDRRDRRAVQRAPERLAERPCW